MINKKILALLFLAVSNISIASNHPQHDEHCYHLERIDRQSNEIVKPSMIVVNYTTQPALENAIVSFKKARASAHYMIDTDGTIYESMHETPQAITSIDTEYLKRRAWHAGHAYWNGDQQEISDVNSHAIGILFVNEGALPKDNPNVYTNDVSNTTQWFDFTPEQQASFVNICQQLKTTYNIADKDIVGHGEVAINPTTKSLGRKIGPGPRFPWKQIAEQGVGLCHNVTEEELAQPCDNSVSDLQEDLHAWGYSVQETGQEDEQTKQAVAQLQIHHDSQHIDGDIQSCRVSHIIKNLLAQHYAQKNNSSK
ncbi:MAG: N-acetylmuramoyl-L-alanine amidase [Candidatus Chromulinivorax sp.]|nr:N-acetylmuramoyl-L-alanine amidase [Candidatus Chromulinivorax sp.]